MERICPLIGLLLAPALPPRVCGVDTVDSASSTDCLFLTLEILVVVPLTTLGPTAFPDQALLVVTFLVNRPGWKPSLSRLSLGAL